MSKKIEQQVTNDLNQLAEIRQMLQSYNEELEETVQQALRSRPELDEQYGRIKEAISQLSEKAANLTDGIKNLVLKHGSTIKSEFLRAEFGSGKTSWDSKGLAGYAVANPQILEFKKTGNPYVSIKEVK